MVEEFKNAMLTSGIVCRDDIIADGQIHRFPTKHKERKDGWFVFHGLAGAFGDWSQGIHEKWSVGNSSFYFGINNSSSNRPSKRLALDMRIQTSLAWIENQNFITLNCVQKPTHPEILLDQNGCNIEMGCGPKNQFVLFCGV